MQVIQCQNLKLKSFFNIFDKHSLQICKSIQETNLHLFERAHVQLCSAVLHSSNCKPKDPQTHVLSDSFQTGKNL